MINRIQQLVKRPERGWDPVPRQWAEKYAVEAWGDLQEGLVDELEANLGGLTGKRVLDLGGGPGQYCIAFAKRGADVTWHDVSRNYQEIARQYAEKAGVQLELSLGYLEDAARFISSPFDLVFCRGCWSYAVGDRSFASLIYRLVKPGGAAYIWSNTALFRQHAKQRRLIYFLNERFCLKIGHPFPPPGRIARLLASFPIQRMTVDLSLGHTEVVFFVRAGGAVSSDK